jgi:hypothetical protein
MQRLEGVASMSEDTEAYYRRRCSEELDAAERATDPIAAGIHRSLAERYSALAGESQVRSLHGTSPAGNGTRARFSSVD